MRPPDKSKFKSPPIPPHPTDYVWILMHNNTVAYPRAIISRHSTIFGTLFQEIKLSSVRLTEVRFDARDLRLFALWLRHQYLDDLEKDGVDLTRKTIDIGWNVVEYHGWGKPDPWKTYVDDEYYRIVKAYDFGETFCADTYKKYCIARLRCLLACHTHDPSLWFERLTPHIVTYTYDNSRPGSGMRKLLVDSFKAHAHEDDPSEEHKELLAQYPPDFLVDILVARKHGSSPKSGAYDARFAFDLCDYHEHQDEKGRMKCCS